MVTVKNGGLLSHCSILLALVFKPLSGFRFVDKLLVGSEISHNLYILWFSLSCENVLFCCNSLGYIAQVAKWVD